MKLAGLTLTSFLFKNSALSKPVRPYFSKISSKAEMNNYSPPYLELHRRGILKERAEILKSMMHRCNLCPRTCETNRLRGRQGDCHARDRAEIATVAPHFGEEDELVGKNGSGTIFFTNCSLLCVFCINSGISQKGQGREISDDSLARAMLKIQELGCHNLNLVTPTHYSPHILNALDIAAGKGLRLPVVYNTSGWERMDILQLLDGVVDIYLADFKYFHADSADKYSPGASSYPDVARDAIIEMNRQVGVAYPDSAEGLINRGLMIRHLVMPNNICGSDQIMHWIGENLPKETYVNIMSQYMPAFKADKYPQINRRITKAEYHRVIQAARDAGLRRAFGQSGQ